MNLESLCNTLNTNINEITLETYISPTRAIRIMTPICMPVPMAPTITSVTAAIISNTDPRLINTDANKVLGYRHRIPILTHTTNTYAIVYGLSLIHI